jgi:hypothetical protein
MKHEYHEGPEALERFEKGNDRTVSCAETRIEADREKGAPQAVYQGSKRFNCTGRFSVLATLTAWTGLWPLLPRPCRI